MLDWPNDVTLCIVKLVLASFVMTDSMRLKLCLVFQCILVVKLEGSRERVLYLTVIIFTTRCGL